MTTIPTRQLQQFTQDNYNNKHSRPTTITHEITLKLATINTRQVRILQHVQKLKTHKQGSTVSARQYWQDLTRITGFLHGEHYTCFSHLAQIFLEWEMFHTKFAEEIKTHKFFRIFFPLKSCCLNDNVEKYCRAVQVTILVNLLVPY